MMLTIVGIRLCELNPRRAVHMVDGANVGAVCADSICSRTCSAEIIGNSPLLECEKATSALPTWFPATMIRVLLLKPPRALASGAT